MEKDLEDLFDSESASNGGVFDQQHCQNYVWIWESELQFTAGVAARGGCIETGGELYGLFSHARRVVIMFAGPPGPNAVHKSTRFTQDIDFLRKTNTFLKKTFGLQIVGDHHSHHGLTLYAPSPIDIRSTNSIARKNGYQRFVQLISTTHKVGDRDSDHGVINPGPKRNRFKDIYRSIKTQVSSSPRITFIQIHPYIYPDAASGNPVRCPLRILRGTSPFRRAIMRNSIIPELTRFYKFPMDRILLDAPCISDEPRDRVAELPARICHQLHELPEAVLEDIRVIFKEGLTVLSLPIAGAKGRILIGYNERPPHRVEAVFLRRNEEPTHPIEITKQALCFDPLTSLARIYNRVGYLINKEMSPTRRDNSIETEEKQGKKEETTNEQRQESQTVKEGDEYPC